MNLPIYQIDAFTTKPLSGNPAAVCPLDSWLDDDLMQNIARENNLSETAFFVPLKENQFHLRWFTPDSEIDLCGHATLASSFVIFNFLNYAYDTIVFATKSGNLNISQDKNYIIMDFPLRNPAECSPIENLETILGFPVLETLQYDDKFLCLIERSEDIKNLTPDFSALASLTADTIILTAADDQYDFVSRYFHPKETLKEDPVTGSAHCILAPYWQTKLNKDALHAYQVSPRGGELFCEVKDDRVFIKGEACLYLQGEISL